MKLLLQILLLFGFYTTVQAQQVQVQMVDIKIHGTSTLHDWTSQAEESKLNVQASAENGSLTGFQSVTLTVPVKKIKSPKGSMMDNKTYDALKADKHPNITFQLTKASQLSASGTVSAHGKLTIAGKTKDVVLSAKVKNMGNGIYEISGTQPVKMSDHDMKAPTALMGTVKTGDDVRIEYKVKISVK